MTRIMEEFAPGEMDIQRVLDTTENDEWAAIIAQQDARIAELHTLLSNAQDQRDRWQRGYEAGQERIAELEAQSARALLVIQAAQDFLDVTYRRERYEASVDAYYQAEGTLQSLLESLPEAEQPRQLRGSGEGWHHLKELEVPDGA